MLVLWYYIAGLLTQVSYGSILSDFLLEQTLLDSYVTLYLCFVC